MPQMTKVFSRYGAPMGRRGNVHGYDETPCRCFKVNLDSGGYDDGGAYWGHGEPLYCTENSAGFRVFLRAKTRIEAIRQLKDKYDTITFKKGM